MDKIAVNLRKGHRTAKVQSNGRILCFHIWQDIRHCNTHSRLDNLAHKLRELKEEISQDMMVSKILVTLPEYYKHFATAWQSSPRSEKNLKNLTMGLLLGRTHIWPEHRAEHHLRYYNTTFLRVKRTFLPIFTSSNRVPWLATATNWRTESV